MIVGSYFNGDDNTALAWKQHDVYGEALRILVSTCNRYATFAKALVDDTVHHDWGRIDSFDHRVLQLCHDLLAAAWRFKSDCRQGSLPFKDAEDSTADEFVWLDWLRNEVAGWLDRPHLVRSLQLILTNQNQPIGYLAESQLCLDTMRCFPDVPWEEHWRDAIEKDLASAKEELRKAADAAANEE